MTARTKGARARIFTNEKCMAEEQSSDKCDRERKTKCSMYTE